LCQSGKWKSLSGEKQYGWARKALSTYNPRIFSQYKTVLDFATGLLLDHMHKLLLSTWGCTARGAAQHVGLNTKRGYTVQQAGFTLLKKPMEILNCPKFPLPLMENIPSGEEK
jgi:hypothetical protein